MDELDQDIEDHTCSITIRCSIDLVKQIDELLISISTSTKKREINRSVFVRAVLQEIINQNLDFSKCLTESDIKYAISISDDKVRAKTRSLLMLFLEIQKKMEDISSKFSEDINELCKKNGLFK